MVSVTKKDMDGELKTMRKDLGTSHQPPADDNVAGRGPGATMPAAKAAQPPEPFNLSRETSKHPKNTQK